MSAIYSEPVGRGTERGSVDKAGRSACSSELYPYGLPKAVYCVG